MPKVIHKLLLLLALISPLNSCLIKKREVVYEVKKLKTNDYPFVKQKALLVISPASLNVGDIYHVYLLPENEGIKGNEYGIVFTANDWDNVLPRDSSKIKLSWTSGDTLKIAFDKKLRILNQVIKTRENTIIYDTFNN